MMNECSELLSTPLQWKGARWAPDSCLLPRTEHRPHAHCGITAHTSRAYRAPYLVHYTSRMGGRRGEEGIQDRAIAHFFPQSTVRVQLRKWHSIDKTVTSRATTGHRDTESQESRVDRTHGRANGRVRNRTVPWSRETHEPGWVYPVRFFFFLMKWRGRKKNSSVVCLCCLLAPPPPPPREVGLDWIGFSPPRSNHDMKLWTRYKPSAKSSTL